MAAARRVGLNSIGHRDWLNPARRGFAIASNYRSANDNLPRVVNPSFWSALIPKFLRRAASPRRDAQSIEKAARRRDQQGPAFAFIVLSLLTGSQAIQLLILRHQREESVRRQENKIALLKEVLERLHNNEDIDVDRILGTGDPGKEKEWEEVLAEIEQNEGDTREDRAFRKNYRKEAAENARAAVDGSSRSAEAEPNDTNLQHTTNEAKMTGKPRPNWLT